MSVFVDVRPWLNTAGESALAAEGGDPFGRLADDGCPHEWTPPHTWCVECYSPWGRIDRPEGEFCVLYGCDECGFEGHDFLEDLGGCMSVPWGFLL